MNSDVKKQILRAFWVLVRPIIKLALRNGLTYREFSDLCKKLYVAVAAEDYGVHGRDTNVSRIALITGINRKDIKKIKEQITNGESLDESYAPDRVSRILTGWHQDSRFLDDTGRPLELPLEGEGPDFSELVSEYAGSDFAAITVLRELKRSRVIAETESGNLKVLKRSYIPNPSSNMETEPAELNPKLIHHASSILNDHIVTIFHNLYRQDAGAPLRFERRATNHEINKAAVPEFQQFAEKLGQGFLEDIDNWLSEHEADTAMPENKRVRLGMGTYWIEGLDTNLE